MVSYGVITPALIEELASIVGAAGVVTDEEALGVYARDETEDLFFPPDVVVKPASTSQVSGIMRLATRERIPVTPRGAGTGLSGGALATRGGICLTFERMNRILEIDAGNQMAVVEPGVITQVLQDEVENLGLYYPPDPASRGSCTLGGNVAEDAGGPHAVKYGVTRAWVSGLEAVLADGTVFTTGGKLRKDASGFNLTQLLVGSEGTLAIVTRIVLRLIPLPACRRALIACFDDEGAAARAVAAVFNGKVMPAVVEWVEGEAWRLGCRRTGSRSRIVAQEHPAYLLLEVDGMQEAAVEEEAMQVGRACLDSGAADVVVAETPAKREAIWAVRRAIGEAVKKVAPYKEEDTVVPRSRLSDLVGSVRSIADRHGLRAICYGHAGDGNLHVNLLKGDDDAWSENLSTAIRAIFSEVAALGGKISGEHGIGLVQRDYMPIAHGPAELAVMRAIKDAFDPLGILNPGKVLPEP